MKVFYSGHTLASFREATNNISIIHHPQTIYIKLYEVSNTDVQPNYCCFTAMKKMRCEGDDGSGRIETQQ